MKSTILLHFVVWIIITSEFSVKSQTIEISDAEKFDNHNGTSHATNTTGESVCNNKICENAAELIKNGRNESAEPCNDFYSFVCSKWSNNYPIPENHEYLNIETMSNLKLQDFIKEILQKPINPNDSFHLFQEKKWFEACNNTERILSTGQNLLINITEQIGGMPMTMNSSEWEKKNISWQKVDEYYARLTGKSAFFNLQLLRNGNKSQFFVAKPPSIDIDKKSKMILQLFVEEGKLNISLKDVKEIKDFHKALNEIINDNLSRVEHVMTIEQFQNRYDKKCPKHTIGKLNFSKIFPVLFNGLEIKKTDVVQFHSLYFVKNLCNLFLQTSSKTIVNYIHWRFLVDSFDYWYMKNDSLFNKNRLNDCLSKMPFNEGYTLEILSHYLPTNTVDLAQNMFYDLRVFLYTKILNSSWINDEDLFIRLKLAEMKFYLASMYDKDMSLNEGIGFSNYNFNITSDFLQNWINFKKSRILKIGEMIEESSLGHDIKKRSLYLSSENSLKITLEELASPLFNVELPNAINYGYLGFNIAQGMARAFGKEDREYNEETNPGKWLTEMINQQEKKLECFANNLKSDSSFKTLIVDNRFADTVGLNIAFEAYQHSSNITIVDLKLPGLEDLDGSKLFFTSFAMNFCANIQPQFANKFYSQGIPTPSDRVNAAVSNSHGFLDAFQCKEGDTLWKEDKCDYFS